MAGMKLMKPKGRTSIFLMDVNYGEVMQSAVSFARPLTPTIVRHARVKGDLRQKRPYFNRSVRVCTSWVRFFKISLQGAGNRSRAFVHGGPR